MIKNIHGLFQRESSSYIRDIKRLVYDELLGTIGPVYEYVV